jgi:threonyl-tRNA synthetase
VKARDATRQLDYAAPERFDLTYVGEDDMEHRPVTARRCRWTSSSR